MSDPRSVLFPGAPGPDSHERHSCVRWARPLAGVLALLLCSLSSPARGQATEPAAAAREATAVDMNFLQPWRWVQFTTASGLPSDRVHQVLETPDGGVWAATREGLARFDGYEWLPLPASSGLPSGGSPRLALGPRDELLIVVEGDVYVAEGRSFSRLSGSEGAQIHDAVALGEEILVRAGDGVGLLRPGGIEPLAAAPWEPGERVSGIIADPPATVWLRTRSGVYRWRDGTWIEIPGQDILPGDWEDEFITLAVTPDRDQALGLFRSGAIRRFVASEDPDRAWSAPLPLPDPMRAALFLGYRSNGDLWVGTDRGLWLFRSSIDLWRHWRHEEADRRNVVNEIVSTGDGGAWVATDDGVEVRAADGSFQRWDRIGSDPLRQVTGLTVDGRSDVWITSAYAFGGAYRWDGAAWSHHPSAPGSERIFRARTGPDGTAWFAPGTEPGILRATPEGLRPWPPASGAGDRRIFDLAWTPEGHLWVASSRGIGLWNGVDWSWWGLEEGLRDLDTWILEADAEGRAWFSDGRNGVGTLEPDGGTPRYLTVADGLVSDQVQDLWVADDGALWVAAEGGLSRYRNGSWSRLGSDSGLSTLHLSAVSGSPERIFIGSGGAGVQVLRLEEAAPASMRVRVDEPVHARGTTVVSWKVIPFWGFAGSGEVESRYRVDDGPWSEWMEGSVAHLDDVGFGEHELVVESRAGLDESTVATGRAGFVVPYPTWRGPEFLVPVGLLVAAILGLGAVFVRRKLQHDREMAASRARLELLLHHLPATVWVTDRDLEIRSMQGALLRHHGYEVDHFEGSTVQEISRADDDSGALEAHREALEGRPATRTVRRKGRLLQLRTTPLFDRNRAVVGTVGLAVDVTDQRQLEEELENARKLEAVGQLAGGVAHDFNNLLVAINGYAELVLEELDVGDPIREDVREIARAGDRAAKLTAQLLAFGRRQRRKPEILNLDAVIDDSETLLRKLVGEGVRLVRRREAADCWIEADRGQIEQVLMNLAVNARDAMSGEGRLEIATGVETLDSTQAAGLGDAPAGEYALLEVRDSGTGISDEHLEHIFEPFFTTKGSDGTGLGLATVYGVVKQTEGWITVDGGAGTGATFRVYFPCRRPRDSGEEPDRPAVEIQPGEARVLLVEDEPAVREVLSRSLESLGYRVWKAADAEEAQQLIRQRGDEVDLLITDVVMPGMDGAALVEWARRRIPGLRALLISGYSDRMVEVGDDAWTRSLGKPFTREELAKTLAELMASGSGRKGSGATS